MWVRAPDGMWVHKDCADHDTIGRRRAQPVPKVARCRNAGVPKNGMLWHICNQPLADGMLWQVPNQHVQYTSQRTSFEAACEEWV